MCFSLNFSSNSLLHSETVSVCIQHYIQHTIGDVYGCYQATQEKVNDDTVHIYLEFGLELDCRLWYVVLLKCIAQQLQSETLLHEMGPIYCSAAVVFGFSSRWEAPRRSPSGAKDSAGSTNKLPAQQNPADS